MSYARNGKLSAYVVTLIAMVREDEQKGSAGFDCIGDFIIKRRTRTHVARRDPASHAATLQFFNDLQSNRSVFADVADKDEKIGVGEVVEAPRYAGEGRGRFDCAGNLSVRIRSDTLNALHEFIKSSPVFLGRREIDPESVS